MLALSAELVAHLVEARHQRTTVLLRGLAVDDDAPGGEGGPQGEPRDSNERRLKAVCQIERELDTLFAVALDVEVDHHCRKGHHLFPVSFDQTRASREPLRRTMIQVKSALRSQHSPPQRPWIDLR